MTPTDDAYLRSHLKPNQSIPSRFGLPPYATRLLASQGLG
jgi:hypothetical protein